MKVIRGGFSHYSIEEVFNMLTSADSAYRELAYATIENYETYHPEKLLALKQYVINTKLFAHDFPQLDNIDDGKFQVVYDSLLVR